MVQRLSSSLTATMRPSPSAFPSPKPKRPPGQNPKPRGGGPVLTPCKHSASATLELLIFLLVLFAVIFLIASSSLPLLSALACALPSLLAPVAAAISDSPASFLAGLLVLVVITVAAAELSCHRSRTRHRCQNPRCRGLRKAKEFDVQLQTEELLRSSPTPPDDPVWQEIEGLPWKGGQQGNNPDYECLRAELRRMAPPNGRAVMLFRSRCGCPVAKLEAWAPKQSRRHRKGMAHLAIEGGHR